jgi:beta-N-acetylhexosaminidase
VAGKRVGLVTNHTGVDRRGRTDIDLLADHPDVELVALYSPEHGIRGEERAGAAIASGVDERTGLPVHSLYGETRKPTAEMLSDVDVLLFDMQDVGARYYTYVSTMALAMEAAGEHGIPFIVLDRPNPIRGDVVQGNVLDPAYSTFVGMYPVPMRHGMTPGELARMYAGAFDLTVDLRVMPVDGWSRDMTYDDTELPWIAPSPNMPSLASALAYPGTCLFEGTPISVGRGTDRAFQWIGAPWLDGPALAAALNEYGIAGVRFEATSFTPVNAGDGKFEGVEVRGVELVPESSDYDAPRAVVAMLIETRRASGAEWSWRASHFDRLAGTDALRLGLERGDGLEALTAGWGGAIAAFERLRAPYLIYR